MLDFILNEMPMDQGWAFYSWSMENDGWLQFCGVRRDGKGYMGQQAEHLMELARKAGWK